MNVLLKKGNDIAAILNITIGLCGIYIYGVNIVNADKLPPVLKAAATVIQNADIDPRSFFDTWLRSRTIPNDRINIDEFLLSFYRYKQSAFGRMYPYKYTATALAYFASGFDNYTISPEKTETICHIYQDPRFYNLYFWKPLTPERKMEAPEIVQIIRGGQQKTILKNGYYTKSFTISSKYPSWWEENCLIQEPLYDQDKPAKFKEIADQLGLAGCRYLKNGMLVTDYQSDPLKETVFLSDVFLLDSYLEHAGKYMLSHVINAVGKMTFGSEVYEKLLEIARQWPEYFSARNLGYDIGKKKLVGIL